MKDKLFYEALMAKYGEDPKLARFYRSKIREIEAREKEERQKFLSKRREDAAVKGKPLASEDDFTPNRKFISLASEDCNLCKGFGTIGYRIKGPEVCRCVFKEVARLCTRKWRESVIYPLMRPAITLRSNGPMIEFPQSDYLADFEIILRRVLSGFAYSAYRLYNMEGHTWRVALNALNEHYNVSVQQSEFQNINQKSLIRMGEELLLCGLFPFGEYFAMRTVPLSAFNPQARPKSKIVFRDPWLGGGSWEDFRDRPEYNEQFESYQKVGPKPMSDSDKFINDKPDKRRQWITRKRYRALYGKGSKAEEGHGINKLKAMTQEYCAHLGMVGKDYEWLDGDSASTLFKLNNHGEKTEVAVHIAKFEDGWRVFDKTKGATALAGTAIETFEEAKKIANRIAQDVLDDKYTNLSSRTNLEGFRKRERKRERERLEGEKFSDD